MNFEIEKIPNKITPCPIVEAIVEVRFESSMPPEAIPGVAISSLSKLFPKIETLPVMQLPLSIRDNDPNLKFSPQYKQSNGSFVFLIGPRSFSVVCPQQYQGWSSYYNQICEVFNKIQPLGIVDKITRVAVRYISFFEDTDIFQHLDVEIKLASNSLIGSQNILRSEFDYNNFKCVIQLANSATFNNITKGSSVDIDVITTRCDFNLQELQKTVVELHDMEKKLFFKILNSDFLTKNFNPEYS